MNRPGFRRASHGGFATGGSGGKTADESAPGAPFSQAQILHLMKSEFSRARRHGYPLTCVLMRIEALQAAVDRHGPSLREEARFRLGAMVAGRTRDHDHLGLLRDESFLLVLPHTDGESAIQVAARIAVAFQEIDFKPAGEPVQLVVNMGVATCVDKDTLFFDTLVSQAEMALEQAEIRGGGQVEMFRRERLFGE